MIRRLFVVPLLGLALTAAAQRAPEVAPVPPTGQLDPTRTITSPQLFSSFHQPVPEHYIWTRDDSPAHRADARAFRVHFQVDQLPPAASLYIAGPHSVDVTLNGKAAGHFVSPPNSRLPMHVFVADLLPALHSGDNTLVLDTGGETHRGGAKLVAKIIPAGFGVVATPILVSDAKWEAAIHAPGAPPSDWAPVSDLGGIESNIDFFQWNEDAGLYDWPGYEGASPFLAHTFLTAERVQDAYAGQGSFDNVDALTSANTAQNFTVHLNENHPLGEFVPGITLDFGREVAGRVQLVSAADRPITVSIAYGESIDELNNEPYLGVDVLHVTPHGTGVGPKSAFRYARVRFLAGPATIPLQSIRLEAIYYPVHYLGSFSSSDDLLNRIWEVGVYTSHLCMQDDIWDAPKRDRGRWMGDTDVSGRVIDAVFADRFLLEDTLTRLIGPTPVEHPVNGIPGYSSFWFTELADYVRHTGRTEYVQQEHDALLQLLAFMDQDFDAQNQFINKRHSWLYVDWSLQMNGDTPETRRATAMEYVRAYRVAAWLLRQIHDDQTAAHWEQRADAISKTMQTSAFDEGSYGPRWQTNAMAVISGVAAPEQYGSIWQKVLADVGKPTYRPDIITPYYGSYVLDAMAEMDHREAALAWIREFWGGMVNEGATSFWEAYDPSWPKRDPHVDLQADDTAGYRISLAHGWSSAPAYWLMDQVLGIQPTGVGFAQTTIRPDLLGLTWAKGAEPTPHGLLQVSLQKAHDQHSLHLTLDVPDGVQATVLYPVVPGAGHVLVNGTAQQGAPAENGARIALKLDHGGHYEIHAE